MSKMPLVTLGLALLLGASSAGAATVPWDLTHGVIADFQPSGKFANMVGQLAGEGIDVVPIDDGILSHDLSDYDAVVVAIMCAWDEPYTSEEADAIAAFTTNGGGLLLIGDSSLCPNEHIAPFGDAIGTSFAVSQLEPSDFYFSDFVAHPIFAGVGQLYYLFAFVAEGGATPVGLSTWGSIKTLFR